MDGINIGYFRVSKEDETLQDLDSQIEAVKSYFSVDFDVVYKERGSAYDLNKIHKRTEFLNLLDKLFSNTSLKDVFMGNLESSNVNIYVWDYDRIMRNIALNTLFLALCDIFNVTMYSYKDGKTRKNPDETPTETFARYMLLSVHAFTGEQYSYTISTNIKKSVEKSKNLSARSKDGKKWGRQFVDIDGENVILSDREEILLRKRILKLVREYEKMKFKGYYNAIINEIERKHGLKISKQYISNLRHKDDKDGKKWGRQFVDIDGENVILSDREEILLRKRILKLVREYEKMKFKRYYIAIINEIEQKHGLKISKQYISNLRHKDE